MFFFVILVQCSKEKRGSKRVHFSVGQKQQERNHAEIKTMFDEVNKTLIIGYGLKIDTIQLIKKVCLYYFKCAMF